MSTELIRQVAVHRGSVYLESKSNNDDCPFRLWKCDGLTEVFQKEGQHGLDREMLIMLCEYAKTRGNHPSVARYRSCLPQARALREGTYETVHQAYQNLAPEDAATLWDAPEQRTSAAQAHRQMESELTKECYAQIALLALQLPEKAPAKEGKRHGRDLGAL